MEPWTSQTLAQTESAIQDPVGSKLSPENKKRANTVMSALPGSAGLTGADFMPTYAQVSGSFSNPIKGLASMPTMGLSTAVMPIGGSLGKSFGGGTFGGLANPFGIF